MGILGNYIPALASNPIYQGFDQNRNTIGGFAGGLLSGANPQSYVGPVAPAAMQANNPMANAIAGGQQGRQMDQQVAQAAQAQNATVAALAKYPDLASMVAAKAITPEQATIEMFKRMDAKASNPVDLEATASGRAQLADQYGLTGPVKAQYVLSKQLPADFGAQANPNADMSVGLDPATGLPNPDQQAAFLATLSPSDARMVKNMINYQTDVKGIASMKNNERQRLVSLAQQADPTFDTGQATARLKTRIAFSPGGTQGQTVTAANTAIGHLARLADEAGKLNNGGFTPGNAVWNAGKALTSNPDLAKFNEDRTALASEMAKFYKGTGATDMTTTDEWLKVFDPNLGSDTLKSQIHNAIGLMKSKLDEMSSQYGAAMGRPTDFSLISPETQNILKGLGVDTTGLTPPVGGTAAPAATTGQTDAATAALYQKYGITP